MARTATSDFGALARDGFNLYRGGSGRTSRAIMSAAVGPVRAAAKHIRDHASDLIPAGERATVFRIFSRALCGPGTVAMPYSALADNLDMLLNLPRILKNLFTSFEHVVWEAPINKPFTGRQLESVTIDPRMAILYAYGIDTDSWHRDRSIVFFRETANAEAFIAVLNRDADSRLAIIHAQSVYGGPGLTEEEAKRRVQQDGEVLLDSAETPAQVIDLPTFDVEHPEDSLNAAARHLINNAVAH